MVLYPIYTLENPSAKSKNISS